MEAYLYLAIYALIKATRVIIIKKTHVYFLFNMFIMALCLYLGGVIGYLLTNNDSKNNLKSFISLEPHTIIPGVLSQIRFIAKYYGLVLTPCYIGIPLTMLWIIAAAVFDNILNGAQYNRNDYIQIILLLTGIVIINYEKIFYKKKREGVSMFGIMLILFSNILTGYLLTFFRKYSITEPDPFKTIILEGKGSVLTMVIIFLFIYFFKRKLLVIPPNKIIIRMIFIYFIVFNLALYFKIKGLRMIEQIKGIIFLKIGTIFSIVISIIYFNEKLNKIEYVGMGVILLSILSSVYIS